MCDDYKYLMQHTSNYNFNLITSSSTALTELEHRIQQIIEFVKSQNNLGSDEFNELSAQINLLKDLYSVTERCLQNDQ